jgi:hypothetical protein
MAWLFARESAVSNSASDSPVESTAPFVTLSGKPTQRPLSWRGWKQRPWIALLSGTISDPLMANRGAASWIASLLATRANRSPTPVNEQAPTTIATSGPRSHESSESASPDGASLRTSPAIYLLASRKSFPTWSAWATELRRVCSLRRKWVRRIDGSGCLSWQTPSVVDSSGRDYTYPSGDKDNPFPTLPGQAESWATPHVNCTTGAGTQGRDGGENLQTQVASHPAPLRTGVDSPATSGRRSLNPRFVEWLMGLPLGWTACVPAEMQSFHSWRHTHSRALQTLLAALRTWEPTALQRRLEL